MKEGRSISILKLNSSQNSFETDLSQFAVGPLKDYAMKLYSFPTKKGGSSVNTQIKSTWKQNSFR